MRVRKFPFLAGVSLAIMGGLYLAGQVLFPSPLIFRGHSGRVHDVIASPDGKTLASLSEDRTIKLWEVATRQERATFQGSQAAFSLDGRILAWTDHTSIRLADVATGQERTAFQGHTGDISAVAFSPDGKILATGNGDNTISLWDLATGQERATCRGHTEAVSTIAVSTIAFSPDGKTLASVDYGFEETIKLWDAATGQERATLRPDGGRVNGLVFSPDSKTLATGDVATTVKLWDVATRTNTATFEASGDEVDKVVFSPDGKTLASLSGTDQIELWDVPQGVHTATFEKLNGRPRPRLWRFLYDTFPNFADDFVRDTKDPLSLFVTQNGKLMALGTDYRDNTLVLMWQVATVSHGKN